MKNATKKPAPPPVAVTPAAAEPTEQDHEKLHTALRTLERLGIALLALSPAIAAPFIKSDRGKAVFAAETPVAGSIAQVLAALVQK